MELAVNQPFDLAATLACGQGHRWLGPDSDGWYESVLGSDMVLIRQKVIDGPLEFEGTGNEAAMAGRLLRQFRLDDDIEAIYGELRRDPRHSEVGGALSGHAGNARRPMGMPGVFRMFRQHRHPPNPRMYGEDFSDVRHAGWPEQPWATQLP